VNEYVFVKKIGGFLFPVSGTNEFRVHQNERDLARLFGPWTED
jgi:hypothetical protein